MSDIARADIPPKTAVITGAAGQDGYLLTQNLIAKGFTVVAICRSNTKPEAIFASPGVVISHTNLDAPSEVLSLLQHWRPALIFHLAATHISSQEYRLVVSQAIEEQMIRDNFLSTKILCAAMRDAASTAHLVFAASSQMYAPLHESSCIVETSPRNPVTLYGLTKSWSLDLLEYFRREHGLRLSTAILFNHESVRRRDKFLSRKVTSAVARIKKEGAGFLQIQNLGSRTDWSCARDITRALQLMAAAPEGADYVVASGTSRSVKELISTAFGHAGLDWQRHTNAECDKSAPSLIGNPEKIHNALGWFPIVSFESLVGEMVDYDLQLIENRNASSVHAVRSAPPE